MKRVSLVQIKANHRARVVEILGAGSLEHKLSSMGIYKAKEITKLSHIGLRGPVVVKAGRSILALGHNVAAKVIVEIE